MTTIVESERLQAEELYEFIGHHIRAHRQRLRWSMQDLANLAGKALTTVTAWETARNRIPLWDLVEIARLFDLPVTAFLPPEMCRKAEAS